MTQTAPVVTRPFLAAANDRNILKWAAVCGLANFPITAGMFPVVGAYPYPDNNLADVKPYLDIYTSYGQICAILTMLLNISLGGFCILLSILYVRLQGGWGMASMTLLLSSVMQIVLMFLAMAPLGVMAFIAGGSPRFSAKDPFWLNLTAFCWTWMQWTYAVMWVFIGVMWIALWYAEKITSVLSPRAVRALPWIGGLHLCSLATLFIYRGPFSPASYGIGTPLLGLSSVWLGWASWALLRALRRAGRRPEEVSEKPLSE